MKKFLAISVIASTVLMAGGDIAPIEEPVVVEPVVTDGGFYLGAAYSLMGDQYTRTPNTMDPQSFDESYSAIMFQAGYKFNSYVAVEGRYWAGVSDITVNNGTTDYDLAGADAWGLYVKPMYPVTDTFDVYALLGYAGMDHDSIKLNDGSGFSWGLGASYGIIEGVDLFIDYTSIYDDDRTFTNATGPVTKDISLDSVNFGVTYNF